MKKISYGGEWSASCSGHFTPRERIPSAHWVWDCIGPRTSLDTTGMRKIFVPGGNLTLIIQPIAYNYKDWPTPEHKEEIVQSTKRSTYSILIVVHLNCVSCILVAHIFQSRSDLNFIYKL
jgi:hypothetical protein